MKKAIFPIVLVALFLFSATKEHSRLATSEELAKALLKAFQKNDSLRFLELYPTRTESNAAFVEPWKDSSIYDHQKMWVEKYYLKNSEMARSMFRKVRQDVISAGYDWSNVQFVSIDMKQQPSRLPGIDYLYKGYLTFVSNGFNIGIMLNDVMKTKEGWNCGLGIRTTFIETSETKRRAEEMSMEADRMIDSMMAANMAYERMRMQQDSTAMADSLKKREEMIRQKKTPK